MVVSADNPFANAVRRVAALAKDVRNGSVRSGVACGVAIALLAAAPGLARMSDVAPGAGVPRAAQATALANEDLQLAKVQATFSVYHACGLLRQARLKLDGVSAGAGIERIRAEATQTLAGAEALQAPDRDLRGAVSRVVRLGASLAEAGLSRVVDAVIDSPSNRAWAAQARAELAALPDRFAAEARERAVDRDLAAFEASGEAVNQAYSGMGCGT